MYNLVCDAVLRFQLKTLFETLSFPILTEQNQVRKKVTIFLITVDIFSSSNIYSA